MPKINNSVSTIQKWLNSDGWLSTVLTNFSGLKRQSLEKINDDIDSVEEDTNLIKDDVNLIKSNMENIKSYYTVNSYQELLKQEPTKTKLAMVEKSQNSIENGLYYHNGTTWRKFGTLA